MEFINNDWAREFEKEDKELEDIMAICINEKDKLDISNLLLMRREKCKR